MIKLVKGFTRYTYKEVEEAYLEMMNDYMEGVEIGILSYQAGTTLKAVDPVAFRCGCADFCSDEFEEFDGFYYSKIEIENSDKESSDE